ncbi:MAG: YybS family protein [Chloroflexota bacterium]|nr:YybS family protein [Chloroflexota bacterium]
MSAIEIAEGALLADIAVLLQLVAIYLPVIDLLTRFVIPIILAVLVLRRGLAVGIMSSCVSCFLIGMLSGLSFMIPVLLVCTAGLFLGVTMRRRWRHLPLLLLGTTGGALAVCGVTVLFSLVTGVPLSLIARQLDLAYQAAFGLADFVAAGLGYAAWWQHTAYPALAPLAQTTLEYWPLLYLATLWIFLVPVVILMYFTTNYSVRLLGYNVRAFPGGAVERRLVRGARRLIGLGRKLGRL